MSGQGRFGGHFVLGHVDEVAKITRIQVIDPCCTICLIKFELFGLIVTIFELSEACILVIFATSST